MAFLFKSKKSQDRAPQSRDGPPSASSVQSAAGRVARDDKAARSTPTGSLNSIDNDASPLQDPEKYAARRAAAEQQQQQQQQSPPSAQQSSNDLPFRNSPSSPPNNNSSLYPGPNGA
ncbi:hypothetical protein PG990_005748 [Apiospora arundinis]